MNTPETLKELRTQYRVPQSKWAKHPLIRMLKKHVGRPVYHWKIPWGEKRHSGTPDMGTAVGDAFYDGGAFYMGPNDSEDRNAILHEFCHALVAASKGKLDQFNFDSTDKDEILTCKVQYYLGVVLGFYTYEELLNVMDEYAYLDHMQELLGDTYDKFRYQIDRKTRSLYRTYPVAMIREVLEHTRTEVLKIPHVLELAGEKADETFNRFFGKAARKYA